MDDKIQTGLRISIDRYREIYEIAVRSGISFNAAILFLADVGLKAINRGVEQEAHSSSHNP